MTEGPQKSPLGTVLQLFIWSVVVGVVLTALGVTPYNLFDRLGLVIRRIADFGADALHWSLQYVLLGAVIVLPVWLLMTLLRRRGGPR